MTSGAGDTRNETVTLVELQNRIDVARELHRRRTWRGHPIQRTLWKLARDEIVAYYDEFCWTCRREWPCPTVVALDGIVSEVSGRA